MALLLADPSTDAKDCIFAPAQEVMKLADLYIIEFSRPRVAAKVYGDILRNIIRESNLLGLLDMEHVDIVVL